MTIDESHPSRSRFSEHPIDRELAHLGDAVKVAGAHERRVNDRMARHRLRLLKARPAQERHRDRRSESFSSTPPWGTADSSRKTPSFQVT